MIAKIHNPCPCCGDLNPEGAEFASKERMCAPCTLQWSEYELELVLDAGWDIQ